MTVTLPPPPADIPELVVDPAGIHDCGADLLAASAQVDDVGSFVAGPARIPGWTGAAGTAYGAGLGPLGRQADAMSLALRGVSRRVDEHGDTMTTLLERRVDLGERRSTLIGDAFTLVAHVDAATTDDEPRLQAESDAIKARVTTFGHDVETVRM